MELTLMAILVTVVIGVPVGVLSAIRQDTWLVLFPGLTISLVVFGFNLLGDALRDAIDYDIFRHDQELSRIERSVHRLSRSSSSRSTPHG